jgi:hypothetical protein
VRFTKLLDFSKAILRLRALDVRMPTKRKPAPKSISPSTPAVQPPRRRLRGGWLALASLVLPALVLSACGGSSSPSTSSAAKEQQAEVKFADFARCLREHGIEAEAATGPGGEGHGLKIKGVGGPAKMEAAQKACKQYQPAPQKLNLSPQQKVERAEAVEKFAKCMREHGIEVHASSSEGHVSIQIHGGGPGAGPNPESPAFQKAQSSCQGLLPFKGGKQVGARGASPAPGGSESASSATGG